MSVLLTGGCGFIGSHTAVELIENGYDVVIADNFVNSKPAVLERIKAITGKTPRLYVADVCDHAALTRVFRENDIEAVIHFAGLKAVAESVEKPIEYYRNNLTATLDLLAVMKENGCCRVIFSSSATVYGFAEKMPLTEDMPLSCTNPYGWTKLMGEQIFRDAARADGELSVVLLRYFNPVGAHPSGLIGEDPGDRPNNLMPRLLRVAVGTDERLTVTGTDYPTHDGTGVRDYIHVCDLAKGHVAALKYSDTHKGAEAINLGTGHGYSVMDLIKAFERVNGVKINYVNMPRRPGDVAINYADPEKAEKLLGWRAELGLDDMVRDAWNWQSKNPKGYQ